MIRYLLLTFFILYFAAAFALPSYRVWKRTGVNPITFGGADDAHDYIGKLFKIVMIGLAIVLVTNSFFPLANRFLIPIFWLDHPIAQLTGYVLLLISLIWTITAQIQMGNSWRIGIDNETKTKLVSTGVFGMSRNPIFLGMIVTLFGLFLALPTAFTLLAFVLGFVLIHIQVRLEEEFLTNTHGEDYKAYASVVRRWL